VDTYNQCASVLSFSSFSFFVSWRLFMSLSCLLYSLYFSGWLLGHFSFVFVSGSIVLSWLLSGFLFFFVLFSGCSLVFDWFICSWYLLCSSKCLWMFTLNLSWGLTRSLLRCVMLANWSLLLFFNSPDRCVRDALTRGRGRLLMDRRSFGRLVVLWVLFRRLCL